MSTYKEHRRENLLALESRYGSLEGLSDAVGVSASYLSQMKKVRHMGDKVARRIEKKLGLPNGMMDLPPGGQVGSTASATGGAKMASVPHFSPDPRVQEVLNDYLSIPAGLRSYVLRKVKEMKGYSETLTPFQRNNFPEPPHDPAGYAAWERELEAELDRARAADVPAPERKTPARARVR